MATLLFAAAGSAIGAGIGGTVLGVSAAVIGQAVGAQIGKMVDARLMGGLGTTRQNGPRLDSLDVMTSSEGNPLSDISGRTAIAGEVIWAAKLREEFTTDTQKVGSGKSKGKVKTTSASYYASFAVSLGEGVLSGYGRVWANNKPVDLSGLLAEGRVRFYPGTETQPVDPLIAAIEGAAPAFRGTAYLVFQDLPIEDYGNTVPQIKVEVWGRSGDMEPLISGVNVIPGSTEWGYLPRVVHKVTRDARGRTIQTDPENANRHAGVSDWSISMDNLRATLPACDTISLVVAWFGTDQRAGLCQIEPRTELTAKATDVVWFAGGLDRVSAHEVSRVSGKPAYGSTPADVSVIEAIQDARARGYRVVLYPFIMMDVQAAQGLPHPSGTGTQADFPWRGRIAPTAGHPVASEVSAFVNGTWGFRNFILNLAGLAAAAGGVDAFLIGSEMRDMTFATDAPGSYPFVDALVTLAADVSAILPGAQISYAADWSEYHSHRSGSDIYFHLDPLWASPHVDFVGIDNYLPVSDWRSGVAHADYSDALGHTSVYALDYLKSNVEGGEYFDWYYADDAARAAQIRTPIFDAAHGEDWIFRQKAIRAWHGAAHHNRPGGVRSGSPTAWVPGSKPVWFTELGCPAIDLGSNQPNVFVSRTSSESAVPHFSAGTRDDFMQRQFLRAVLEWWRDNGGAVLDVGNVQVWAWDARPWPEFPNRASLWADGPDWTLGHWLNGRAGTAPVAEAIRRRLTERHGYTLSEIDLTACYGQADGYAAPGILGFRDYVQPFEVAMGLQSHEADGQIRFESRDAALSAVPMGIDDMTDAGSSSPFTVLRSAIEDVAAAAVFKFRDGVQDYGGRASRATISSGPEDGVSQVESPLVLDFARGSVAVERILRAARVGRETITFSVPRSATHLRPGIIIPVNTGDATGLFMIDKITEGTSRAIEARLVSRSAWGKTGGVSSPSRGGRVFGSEAVLLYLLDLPKIAGVDANDWDGFAAAHAAPWPGTVAVARSASASGGFADAVGLDARATMGEVVAPLAPDRSGVWTPGPLDVRIYSGSLVSRSDLDVLTGLNMLAIRHPDGWELVQYRDAQLIAAQTYRLTGLLRGMRGTETIPAPSDLAPGAEVVAIDGAVTALGLASDDPGRTVFYRYGPASTDPATHATQAETLSGVGLRPFAPAHLFAQDVGGDTVLSWIRRTRLPVAMWAEGAPEAPLDEVSEAYRVQIGPEGAPVRVFDVTFTGTTYTAAMRAADGLTAPFRVAVAQISQTFGPGSWAELIVLE